MVLVDHTSSGDGESYKSFDVFDAAVTAAVGRPLQRPNSGDSLDDTVTEAHRLTDLLVETLGSLPDSELIRRASAIEQRLAAERLLAVARVAGSSGDVSLDRRRARNSLDDTGRSNRGVNAEARRAAAIAANDQLGEQLASGSISPDAIDALSKAADAKTGSIPGDLLNAVGGLEPDQAAGVVDRYLEDTTTADEVEARHRQQTKARRLYRYSAPARNGRPAMAGIGLEGPDVMIDQILADIEASADRAYQAAGGRDRHASEHTTFEQRRFDALHNRLVNPGVDPTGGNRPTVVVTIDATELFDQTDDAVATQVGSGPLPRSLLDSYLRHGRLAVLIRGLDDAPLWLGRARRHASDAQFLALAVRDRGCVLCRAKLNRCHAHHLMPWTAPGRGRTDLDQLALLCQRCHGDLHHRSHTLYSTMSPSGTRLWATRPAEPHEIPAPAPAHRQRE